VSAVVSHAAGSGRYDSGARRRSQRRGRETGCWVYVAGEQLQRMGFAPGDPAPFYRTWESSDGRPRLVVNLYRES